MHTKLICIGALCTLLSTGANAVTVNRGRTAVKINGYGTTGWFQEKFRDGKFVGDWRVRGQLNYATARGQTLGAVYAIDQLATSDGRAAADAFIFYEWASLGRVEMGLTDSIARKLGVGLPDVGGLRINDQSLIYKKIRPDGPVIADLTITDGRGAPRINIATMPRAGAQMGLSFSMLDPHYDFATDGAIKIRLPGGKLKTALTVGASYIESPDNMRVGTGSPRLTADWRAQASVGLNIQYNSWIIGLDTRVIYDRDAIGPASDGVATGAGVSYDLLKYTVSATYLFSDTGIFHDGDKNTINHTALMSLRYKYSKDLDGWISLGLSTDTPFVAAGMRVTF